MKKTVNIIFKRIYSDNQIQTSLSKRTLKKLILDSCTKTTFSFNNQLYEQADGVSMGWSLGSVMANIIPTEFENKLVSDLVQFSSLSATFLSKSPGSIHCFSVLPKSAAIRFCSHNKLNRSSLSCPKTVFLLKLEIFWYANLKPGNLKPRIHPNKLLMTLYQKSGLIYFI